MTLDHLKHPPPNSPGWLVQATLPCRPGSNKGASWTTMAQDPGLYVPMSTVTPKMTRSSQSKITTTSNNSYTKMLLLVVGDIGGILRCFKAVQVVSVCKPISGLRCHISKQFGLQSICKKNIK